MFFKTKKFFFLLIAAVSIALVSFQDTNVYADYNVNQGEKCQDGSEPARVVNGADVQFTCGESTKTPGGGAGGSSGAESEPGAEDGKTCAVEQIGWILCPVIKSAATMADWAFKLLAGFFLEIEPELLKSGPESGTMTAWEEARNLANIMFVIAFIAIIYSQITGSGLNNYGIKRMLPRLIIAAIAVNVSYYICQAMVDLSNLLGYNIMEALKAASERIGTPILGQASAQGLDTQTGDGALGKIAMVGLMLTGIVWIILALMGGTIVLILATVLAVVIILLLRKAFIVLLVVISPIAFVMYLLPNTEKLFNKWLSMFWKLLMVFPVVALLLGGGQLASTIILVSGAKAGDTTECKAASGDQQAQAGTGDPSYDMGIDCNVTEVTTGSGEKKQAGIVLSLVAAGVAVAPLLAVWSVLQGALAAAGAIGGKISGAVQKGSNRAGGFAGKGSEAAKKRASAEAQAAWQRSQARGLANEGGRLDKLSGAYARRSARRSARIGASQEEYNRELTSYASSEKVQGNISGLTKAGDQRALARAFAAKDKVGSEETKNALTRIEYYPEGKLEGAQVTFDEAIVNGDLTKAKAATSALTTSGEKGIAALADKLVAAQLKANQSGSAKDHQFVKDLKEYMLQAHGNVKEKNAAIHAWTTNTSGSTVNDLAQRADTYTGLSDAQFATQTEASLNSAGAKAALRAETRNADGEKQTRGNRLLSNPESATNFSDAKRKIIADNGGSTQPHP